MVNLWTIDYGSYIVGTEYVENVVIRLSEKSTRLKIPPEHKFKLQKIPKTTLSLLSQCNQ